MTIEQRIIEALDTVRDAIQADGGDVELLSYDEELNIAYVTLTGNCVGCPASSLTLKFGVERAIREFVPEVEHVIAT